MVRRLRAVAARAGRAGEHHRGGRRGVARFGEPPLKPPDTSAAAPHQNLFSSVQQVKYEREFTGVKVTLDCVSWRGAVAEERRGKSGH